jgi:hypothetical protein
MKGKYKAKTFDGNWVKGIYDPTNEVILNHRVGGATGGGDYDATAIVPETVCEFVTEDNNGNEIYTGDIYRVELNDRESGEVLHREDYIVYYDKDKFAFKCKAVGRHFSTACHILFNGKVLSV